MVTLVRITVFLALLFSTTSCFINDIAGVKGNGTVISEERTLNSTFESIKVQQGITLYITQGTSTNLKVEADENIMDLLITEVKNNELKIYFDKNVYRAKAKEVYLTVDDFSKISASSGSSIKSENTLQLNSLNIDSSSGSSIKITIAAKEVTSESSSGSSIYLFGRSDSFSAESSSGSSIDASELETIHAIAKASSGASIDVNVTGQLTAKASSGGDIDYRGNPTDVNKDTSSGGSVSGS
ncbi:head GIN domain-containing protein [Lutibacter sp.]|uniref:head GIN domain-containing protein n=1 Tax=Lutibacter sp. TaxID=1925666 RepID=UPI002734DA50|nr:head GIN domain-containing protein [Lutibacter sp.]MDP3312237.1 head GIN domain-containing protein [Lutibacter sp.]